MMLNEGKVDRAVRVVLGLALEHLGQRPRLDSAGVAAVAPVGLLGELVAGDPDLLRVDDDDEVAGVDVRGVLGLALAPQRVRELGREPAERLALGVDDVPVALAVCGCGYVGLHSARNREKATRATQRGRRMIARSASILLRQQEPSPARATGRERRNRRSRCRLPGRIGRIGP